MSGDVVITTGRRMTQRLADALDDLTGDDRRLSIIAFNEAGDTSPSFGAIYRAIALELQLCALREQDTLHRLNAQLVGPSESDPPLPPATGSLWTFDPDSPGAA